MDSLLNGLLYAAVLGVPLAIAVALHRFLRRRGLSTRPEPPDTIDYDKW